MRDPQTHLANVRRFVEQVLNRREYVVMYELFSPKHELLAPDPLPSVTGISPYAGNIQHFHEGFSDYCVTVRDRKIGNKGITERQVVEGTHEGALLGIAGTESACVGKPTVSTSSTVVDSSAGRGFRPTFSVS